VRGKEFKKVIYELILKMWQEQMTPHECKYGICPIHKKGDVMMCDNYTVQQILDD